MKEVNFLHVGVVYYEWISMLWSAAASGKESEEEGVQTENSRNKVDINEAYYSLIFWITSGYFLTGQTLRKQYHDLSESGGTSSKQIW